MVQSLLLPLPAREALAPGAALLRGFANGAVAELMADVARVAEAAPFRHLVTPGGFTMSVAMTNCGPLGWVSDRLGYRYSALDPESGKPWPEMPASFRVLARRAADEAGYRDFAPDACLVNRYDTGARLTLHRDADEGNFEAPIVSVSLGASAVFQWGGLTRTDRPRNVPVEEGDVVVFGGPSRLCYHGVKPLAAGTRFNLTFRRARP